MSEGQMIVQMLAGTPVAAIPLSSSGASGMVECHDRDMFAGVLRSMTPEIAGNLPQGDVSSKSSPAVLSRTMGAGLLIDQTGVFPIELTAFLGAEEEQVVTGAGSPATEEQPDQSISEKLPSLQNVDISTAVVQMLAAAQQVNGRMPETGSIRVSEDAADSVGSIAERNKEGQNVVPVIPGRITTNTQTPDMFQVMGTDESVATATQESGASKGGEPFHHAKESVIRQNAVTSAPVQREPSSVSPTTAPELQPAVEIMTKFGATLQRPAENAVQQASHAFDANSSPKPVIRQNVVVNDQVQRETVTVHETAQQAAPLVSIRSVSRSVAEQVPIQDSLPETAASVAKEVVSVVSGSGRTITAEPVSTVADSGVPQPETPSARSVVRPAMSAYFQTSVAPSEKKAVDTASAGAELNRLPHGDAATQPALATRGAAEAQRTLPQAPVEVEPAQREVKDSEESNTKTAATANAAQRVLSSAEGELFQQDGKEPSNQKPGTQDVVMPMHHPKVERFSAQVSTSGPAASEAVRAHVIEQVVSQVREHVTGRDIKSGAEQIVIRLSPENLGELKLNLRMENQCLKVEIVAENSVVRDTLIKHSDTLKETLARQNITMETFDVSTGGNRQGATPHGRDEWQELTRQQQHASWNASRGYRVGETPELPRPQLYQSPIEHSMVDVHF